MSPVSIREAELDGRVLQRGLRDRLSDRDWQRLRSQTFYGNNVDMKMVSLATMNLSLRGLPAVRIRRRNDLATALDRNDKAELGLPLDGDRFEGRSRDGVHRADPSDVMRRLTKEERLVIGPVLFDDNQNDRSPALKRSAGSSAPELLSSGFLQAWCRRVSRSRRRTPPVQQRRRSGPIFSRAKLGIRRAFTVMLR